MEDLDRLAKEAAKHAARQDAEPSDLSPEPDPPTPRKGRAGVLEQVAREAAEERARPTRRIERHLEFIQLAVWLLVVIQFAQCAGCEAARRFVIE